MYSLERRGKRERRKEEGKVPRSIRIGIRYVKMILENAGDC